MLEGTVKYLFNTVASVRVIVIGIITAVILAVVIYHVVILIWQTGKNLLQYQWVPHCCFTRKKFALKRRLGFRPNYEPPK